MPDQTRIVKPGSTDRTVITDSGETLQVPDSWSLLKPGDAGVTRRVKAAGATWTVKAKRGRRVISLGVWAATETIERVTAQFATERSTEAYAKKQRAAKARRNKAQTEYVQEFELAVFNFLAFDERYRALSTELSKAVATHATPVGSGTVARTKRIPVQQRAQAAVIAWLRHQTTAYDDMVIPRIKGKRREVRRMLAEQSRLLLEVYRSGKTIDPQRCILRQALSQ
jgi:hypothetical protein